MQLNKKKEKQLSVRVEPETALQLDEIAKRENVSASEVARAILKEGVEKYLKRNK